jgi:predicted membrane protein
MMKKSNEKNNYLSTKYVIIFWSVLILIAYLIGGINVALGLVIAAIISIIIWNYTLNSSWEGIINEIKTEKVYSGNPDSEHHEFREIKYAYILLNNGKIKKTQSYPDWKKGDKLKKQKGKFQIDRL